MSDRWECVGRLFEQALATSPDARASIVDQSDEAEDVKAEVRALIAAHDSAGEFLEQPVRAGETVLPADPALDEAPPLLVEGTLMGQYRIGGVLGRGGMGVVYEADDTRLHRRVALKSLSPELAREDHQRERLKHEARAAAALTHPGIATIYALEEFDGHLYIVSEYLDGESLRVEMNRVPMSSEAAVATGLEIARALQAAHERGIVHRDLKPENVVRTSTGILKILDFGLAQFDDTARDLVSRTRLTLPGMVAGTPPYMAPEQLLGRRTDFRADQFAFGVLLYELCTGRHPFGSGSMPSVIAQILAAPPRPPEVDDDVPKTLWRVIARCLEKEPSARFDSTRDLVAALEQVSTTLAQSAPPAFARADRSRELRRGPAEAAFGGGHSAPVAPHSAPSTPHSLYWWRFHQFAAAMVYWAMVWPAWHVHRSLGRGGLFFFFAVLAAVVVAGNLRLHLWFSSRVYPEDLTVQRADVSRWIRAADILFAVLLIVGGIALPEDRAGWAAVLISFGIGSALAFLFIEPATARAAFRSHV